MNIWDLGGDPRFKGITYPYVKGSSLLLYVYDMTREETISTLRNLHKTFSERKISCEKVIVIGNKSDEVYYPHCDCSEQGEIFANSINALHLTMSARDNVGIDSLLETIMKLFEIDENSEYKEEEEEEKKTWGQDMVRECRECVIL
jgi:50S ribosomal subunit-associated GTPase HflX